MSDDSNDDDLTPPRASISSPSHRNTATSPIVRLLERDFTELDIEVAHRLRRDSSDPTLLIARLIRAIESERESSDTALQDQLGEALKEHERKLETLMMASGTVTLGIRWGKAMGGFALAVAVSVAGFVAVRMLSGEELKGEYRVRLDHLEKTVDWLLHRDDSRK